MPDSYILSVYFYFTHRGPVWLDSYVALDRVSRLSMLFTLLHYVGWLVYC
jgi:hypothetical protein